ncbi:MAG: hypothetical protein HY308_00005 [Gammaproteobacteria bacterium]|nr:hypothetical protein [Gammaproteobacteria bacterium]
MTIIQFTGSTVALIVRGKNSAAHEPSVMAQHADCILSNGLPVGFYGEDGAGTGESFGSTSGSSTVRSNKIGINMKGVVYDNAGMRNNKRAFYVDAAIARQFGVISTVLIVQCLQKIPADLSGTALDAWLAAWKCGGDSPK